METETKNARASVIVFDIETYSTRDSRMIEKIRNEAVQKRPAKNLAKDKKTAWNTEESRAARGAEAVSKTALNPMLASVLCVVYRVYGLTPEPADYFIDGMADHTLRDGPNYNDHAHQAEGEALADLAIRWDEIAGPDTLWVGHNIEGFDLPVLLGAWLRHDIEPPDHFPRLSHGRWYGSIYDTMAHYPNNNAGFVSLDSVCEALHLPSAKSHIWQGEPMTGARVAAAYESGACELIIEYCAVDVAAEARVFERLTNGRLRAGNHRAEAKRAALAPIWASDAIDRESKKILSFDALMALGEIPAGLAV
jgi:DNA polymerase III epsilon subunit-like protein